MLAVTVLCISAVVVTADPVWLGSSASLTCTVDPSRLQEGVSVSSLLYEWTVGGDTFQPRSSLSSFFLNSVEVNDSRADYGCDVFASSQGPQLFPRALGSLRVNSKAVTVYFSSVTLPPPFSYLCTHYSP